jgi:hypothetical protein
MKLWLKGLLPVLLLLGSAGASFAEYRTVEIERLRIILDTDWAAQCATGYFPVRLNITNSGDDREIRIVGSGQRYFDFRYRRRTSGMFGGSSGNMVSANFSQTIRLKRGDSKQLTIPLPIFADSESFSVRIFENGRPLEGFNSNTFVQSRHPANESAVLFVAEPGSPFAVEAFNWARPISSTRHRYGTPYRVTGPGIRGTVAPTRGTGPSAPPLDFQLEPARIPSNWQGFTSLRAVALGPTEWEQLTPSQQQAILTWTASGGDLFLIDRPLDSVVPPDIQPANLQTTKPEFNNYYLGRIHLAKSADVTASGLATVLNNIDIASPHADWTLPANRAMDWGFIGSRGFRLPIEGVGGVPTKAYLSMLVLFTVVIGPLNYLYLWRKKQQVLMVVTVPVISLLFIGVISAYAFLGEGLAIRGRATTFTLLDQTTKQAATRGSVSLYAGGIVPGNGLTFPEQYAVFPLGPDGYGVQGQMSVDLTESQRFTTGVLEARSPTNFDEIAFGPARERLSFERSDNGFSVVNGLGGNVTKLYYRDNDRIYALDGKLDAGEKGSLVAWPATNAINGGEVYGDGVNNSGLNPLKFQMLIDEQRNGTYLAVLETSPFWDPGVTDLDERSSFHFVLGYVEGQP